MNFIAVDVGSTFIKAALYDLEFNKVVYTRKYYTPAKKKMSDSHYFEVDAMEIVDHIKDIIEKCSEITADIEGIIFSTQQHGCVLCHPDRSRDMYISWQDSRCLKINPETGKSYMDDLSELLPPEIMARTGVPIKPALAMCNLYTLFKEEKLSKTSEVKLYTLGSYIIEKLTGNNVCHITNAAPMGFLNLKTLDWDKDILKRVGLDFLELPKVTSKIEKLGVYSDDNITIDVFPDLGDVQTSIYGSSAKSGDMIVNIATAGQLIMIKDDYDLADYNPTDYEIRPYYDDNYCYVVSRMPGGRNFDVLMDLFKSIGQQIFGISVERDDIYKTIESLDIQDNTGGLEANCGFYELPDQLANGSFSHATYANLTPENMISATAQSFADNYKKFADIMLKGKSFNGTLHFTGGAVLKNEFLRNTIIKKMAIEKIAVAEKDEVYGGMFKLAKRCME